MNNNLKFIILAVLIIIGLLTFFTLISNSPDSVTRQAILANDESLCLTIPPSEFGDLFSRYYCIASVSKNSDFCDGIKDTNDSPLKFDEGTSNRNRCYFAAAIKLNDISICNKMIDENYLADYDTRSECIEFMKK